METAQTSSEIIPDGSLKPGLQSNNLLHRQPYIFQQHHKVLCTGRMKQECLALVCSLLFVRNTRFFGSVLKFYTRYETWTWTEVAPSAAASTLCQGCRKKGRGRITATAALSFWCPPRWKHC